MTEGDKRYIINHTKKSLEEYYNNKGTSMKPSKTAYTTKKKPAKRGKTSYSNPMVNKLMGLKYRINDWYRDYGIHAERDTKSDRDFVMGLIHNIRKRNDYPSKIQLEECNKIWKKYV